MGQTESEMSEAQSVATDIMGRKLKKPPACVQCRTRKIGCDRKHPICGHCENAGNKKCFYPDVPGIYVASSGNKKKEDSATPEVPSSTKVSSTKVSSTRVSSTKVSSTNVSSTNVRTVPVVVAKDPFKISGLSAKVASAPVVKHSSPKPVQIYAPRVHVNPPLIQRPAEIVAPVQTRKIVPQSGGSEGNKWYLINGPVIVDTIRASYTQEELYNREMMFLKQRLLELEKITRKKTGMNLTIEPNDFKSQKRQREENVAANKTVPVQQFKRQDIPIQAKPIEDTQIDPGFLDSTRIIKWQNSRSPFFTLSSGIILNNNIMFNIPQLIAHDDHLSLFVNKMHDVLADKFPDFLKQSLSNTIRKEYSTEIIFPEKSISLAIISLISSKVDVSALFPQIPIDHFVSFINTISQHFQNRPIHFPLSGCLVKTLNIIGLLCLYMLLGYESLSSTVLIKFSTQTEIDIFSRLKDTASSLQSSLIAIVDYIFINMNLTRANKLQVLPFISAYSSYETMLMKDSRVIFQDLDIQYALDLGLNHEKLDDAMLISWNIMERNYYWRKLIAGQSPLLIQNTRKPDNSSNLTSALTQECSFFSQLCSYLKHFQSTNELTTTPKINEIKKGVDEEYISIDYRLVSPAIKRVDSILHRTFTLFHLLIMANHNQNVNNINSFNENIERILNELHDSVVFVFSGFANERIAGLEFVFQNRSLQLLKIIIFIIFSFHQRCLNINTRGLDTTRHFLLELLRKMEILVSDYSKNCKKQNDHVVNIQVLLLLMLEYVKSTSIKSPGHSPFQMLSEASVNKINDKLAMMSESLIKKDFFQKRYVPNPLVSSTFGINSSNVAAVYSTLFT